MTAVFFPIGMCVKLCDDDDDDDEFQSKLTKQRKQEETAKQ